MFFFSFRYRDYDNNRDEKKLSPEYKKFKDDMRSFSDYFNFPDFYIFIPCSVSVVFLLSIALCDVLPTKIMKSSTVS